MFSYRLREIRRAIKTNCCAASLCTWGHYTILLGWLPELHLHPGTLLGVEPGAFGVIATSLTRLEQLVLDCIHRRLEVFLHNSKVNCYNSHLHRYLSAIDKQVHMDALSSMPIAMQAVCDMEIATT